MTIYNFILLYHFFDLIITMRKKANHYLRAWECTGTLCVRAEHRIEGHTVSLYAFNNAQKKPITTCERLAFLSYKVKHKK